MPTPRLSSVARHLLLAVAVLATPPSWAQDSASATAWPGHLLAIVLLGLAAAVLWVSNRRLHKQLHRARREHRCAESALRRLQRSTTGASPGSTSGPRGGPSFYDPLTELPNRSLLYDRLYRLCRDASRERKRFALLLLDLDRFKAVNDTLGHGVGEGVLQQVAVRLQKAGLDTAMVAHLGGDTFVLLLPPGKAPPRAEALAERALAALAAPFDAGGLPIHVGASIGSACYPDDARAPDELLRLAEVAMYGAKRERSGFAAYHPARQQDTDANLALAGELFQALEQRQLLLHYQPKLSLPDGEVIGVEALVRWEHPRDGLLPPDVFIELAERTGLIHPLTATVLDMVLDQVVAWRRVGIHLPVAVNLSVLSLQDPELDRRVAHALASRNLPGDVLALEITESAALEDPQRAREQLALLHRLGIEVAIDDFGTGYSSVAYLKELPVGTLKIDRSFVSQMLIREDDTVMVRAMTELGHNLGMTVIAEGVEDPATLAALARIGCDGAQGFHVARPLPPAALLEWLERRTPATGVAMPLAASAG